MADISQELRNLSQKGKFRSPLRHVCVVFPPRSRGFRSGFDSLKPPPEFADHNETTHENLFSRSGVIEEQTQRHVEEGVSEVLAAQSTLSRPAEEFENDPSVEAVWAMKAFEHAEVYFNILCSVDPKVLRLTKHDDAIYKAFREDFPDLDVRVINEDEMKSPEGKTKWRAFIEKFKDTVEDFSFGTLLRSNVDGDYSEQNSILTTRIQFLAIEIARNREGLNNEIRSKFSPTKKEKK